ncbi:hypothetical protein MLD38_029938 [Melastoma candidum]|uniref:Uncharacterized protein n=1 Tax=Melastoma candidum TaxID=119954 RepID=A0ACB9MKG9_9MYRT|nr:hypothetical protein MLD38_029938 [Melastoma candidum]
MFLFLQCRGHCNDAQSYISDRRKHWPGGRNRTTLPPPLNDRRGTIQQKLNPEDPTFCKYFDLIVVVLTKENRDAKLYALFHFIDLNRGASDWQPECLGEEVAGTRNKFSRF